MFINRMIDDFSYILYVYMNSNLSEGSNQHNTDIDI